MEAVVIKSEHFASSLIVEQRPVPDIGEEDVLIRVRASGINRPDIFQRKGKYPAPAGIVPDIPGLEVAGIVEATGPSVNRWRAGDAICALVAGGGYAQYVTAHQGSCLPVPPGMDFKEAACLPETVFTVWHNVFQRGALKKADRVLIHGGSGGIGTTAIQLASIHAEQVFTTAGSDERCRHCEDLGAIIAVNYHTQDFYTVLKDQQISLILDSIGGSYFSRNINLLTSDGRLVYINAVQGAEVALPLWKVMQKRLSISGSTLRGRSTMFKAALAKEVEQHVWPLIEKGFFKPVLDQCFSYRNANEAHQALETGEIFGKAVLVW